MLIPDDNKIPKQFLTVDDRNELMSKLSTTDVDRMIVTLTIIAAFTDSGGNDYLRRHGRYTAFDEPEATRLARDALEDTLTSYDNK